jgi:3',5'-cyclic AMP phosphodiesterase CpdA
MTSVDGFRIAHFSDLHCGSPHFQADLLERAIEEISELRPEVVVISGDLTTDGYKREYEMAREFVDRIECEDVIVIPGNHDSRNVGYVHFEEHFGPRASVLRKRGVTIVAEDSSEPDLDHGQIGRVRYDNIEREFAKPADLRVFVLHHHLLPIPGTGRERNIVYDAGDLLELLLRSNVNLVLAGHKHVPYAWRLENLFVVTTGTVSTLRLRGHGRPCYNVIEVGAEWIRIARRYPFEGTEPIISFSRETQEYEKADLYAEGIAARGDRGLGARS